MLFQTAQMCRLVLAFTGCLCDKHQSGDEIHLALSICKETNIDKMLFLSHKESNQTNVKYVLFQ